MKKKTGIFDGTRTVLIDMKDVFPVFYLAKKGNISAQPCKIPKKQFTDWQDVCKAYERVQDEMQAAFDPLPQRKKRVSSKVLENVFGSSIKKKSTE